MCVHFLVRELEQLMYSETVERPLQGWILNKNKLFVKAVDTIDEKPDKAAGVDDVPRPKTVCTLPGEGGYF